MAKRFTDTNKYKKPFIRGLQGAYKLLWDYLYHDCDHAGIWIVDFEVAQIYIGSDMPVNKKDALKFFNDNEKRIIEICNGSKWFIPSFIEFQYGKLNEQNRAHNSVINILIKYKLYKKNKVLTSTLQECKEKDMDKEKEIYVYNEFYDEQLVLSNNDSNYLIFIKILFGDNRYKEPLNSVLELPKQLTWKQFPKILELKEQYDKPIREILEELEEWKELNKKRKTVLGSIESSLKYYKKWKKS
jgi:hypothetical protein